MTGTGNLDPGNTQPYTVDDINARLPGSLTGHLGISITAIRDAEMDARMAIHAHHLAPNGYLHAASVVALADSTCGLATFVNLPEGASGFTTIELKTNHLGTATDGTLVCTAKAPHRGRSTHVWETVVLHHETGRRIALFRCTQMILWPK